MKAALIGPSQSGKSTLFSAISGKAPAPSGATRLEEAVVAVPDTRLDWLTALYKPKSTVRASIDCLDLPGVSFLDEPGRSSARRLISQVKNSDMFVLVVRSFKNEAVPPYRSEINPARDIRELQVEFILTDLEQVTTRIEKLEKQLKLASKTKAQDEIELAVQLKLQAVLEEERPASAAGLSEQELEPVRSLGLLTLKPLMVVVNVGEDELTRKFDFSEWLDSSIPVLTVCAKLEHELAQLDQQSRIEFMTDLGIQESAADRFVASCYAAMGLISFLTVGEDEVRAWPIRRGTSALDAAGKVHSDIRRGFIRAETMAYADLHTLGDEKAVKAAGKMRLEGKTYIVQDGDIINYRFNV
ncbi:MAG: redox-regulated ATPase YchF [Deltaproteobacteria bacterium]|nr:redox-regulated ATPase YchF [Deltaproteobacteria bacterium]